MPLKTTSDINEVIDNKVIMGTSADICSFENVNDVVSNKKSLKSIEEEKLIQPKKNLSIILLEKNYNNILDSEDTKPNTIPLSKQHNAQSQNLQHNNINKDEKIIIVLIFIIFSIIFINFYNIYNKNVKYTYTDINYPLRIYK